MITQDILKELFIYEDGNLIRKTTKRKNSIAGSIDKDGYLIIHTCGRKYRAHRLVYLYFNGFHPENDIDHIDGNRLNNRIENIRDVTRSVNMQNLKKAHKNSTSDFLGVSFCKRNMKYRANIYINGKQVHIGTFNNEIDAFNAYLNKKRESHTGCMI